MTSGTPRSESSRPFPRRMPRGDPSRGRPLRIHAAKVSVVRDKDAVQRVAIDTSRATAARAEWEKTERERICRILKVRWTGLPAETNELSQAVAPILPGKENRILLLPVETWPTADEDARCSWWGGCQHTFSLPAPISLPAGWFTRHPSRRRTNVSKVVEQRYEFQSRL